MPDATNLKESKVLETIVKKQASNGRLYAAVCASPAVALGSWGLLKGLKATCYPSFMEQLAPACAATVESRVQQDGKVVTTRGPGTTMEFAVALVEQLYRKGKADEVSGPLVMRANHGDEFTIAEFNPIQWTFDNSPQFLQLVSELDLQPITSMVSTKIDLEKFTSKNDFNIWKVKMEALLITQGLGDALEPITKKEEKEVSSSKTPEMAAEIDKKARSTIILSFGDSVIREVAKEKTIADLWAKLEKIYMTKSLANRLYIKRRMFTLKMAEGSSLDDHIDEFNQVYDTLETIDEGLDDEGKALLLVSSLPQSYSNLVDALMYGRSTLSLDEVKAALNTRGLQEKSGNIMHAKGLSVKATVEEEGYESAGVCVATEDLQRDGGKVMMGNNVVWKVIGIGNVSLTLHDGTIWELREVRYVPDLKRNLISLVTGIIDVIVGTGGVSTRLWHLRLGHMSVKGLKELEKQGVLGKDKIEELDFCEDCVFGKSTRHSFKHSTNKSIGILDYIHSDLWGPAHTNSLGGNSYFLSIIDDYSRRVWVYVLKHKDQVFSKFKEWKTLVENQTRKKVKKLRTDNGLEFCNLQFNSYCANEGITRHKTVRLTASYLVNLSPSTALDFKTPFEIWHEKPASYVNLKVFGCPAYAHVNQEKLAPRALKGQFLGYPDGVKGYKLWCTDLEPPRCIISRDVAFNEKAILEVRKDARLKTKKPQVEDNIQFGVEHPDSKKSERSESSDQDSEDHDECSGPQPQSQRQTQVQGYQLTKDREKRQIRPPQRYGYVDLIAYALAASHGIDVDEPKSYAEAIQSSNKLEWQEAMNKEISSLKKNHTWILVEKAGNRRTMGCKWVFRVKEGLTASELSSYKARLVAKGYTQRERVDFKEVFSPVVRHASIRVLLAMTAVHDLELDQLDVKTAFLQGRLHFDCCVYYKLISSNLYIYLLLYVDDMLVACKSREEIEVLKNLLSSEFEMKDLGSAKKILGMEIKRDRSKATYFKLSSLQCPKTEEEKLEMTKIPYANAVGCMMYVVVQILLNSQVHESIVE
ncbi:Integrase catalytic domain-containing protein [Citrus sinensis]|uniref:Integrase catalytic domain-containing protein n=1 Tax=Citrus sinensis TaxID=2711 RepID=A0ACB8M0U6_CITSI|nr:Integrase catalytic domain-containing protein [Citrus sinensis]